MINGNIKLASLEARINALKLAKQNRQEYLKEHKDIPESEYDYYPNYDHNHSYVRRRLLIFKRKRKIF